MIVLPLQGYITRCEFNELLLDSLNADKTAADALFDKVDSLGTGEITFGMRCTSIVCLSKAPINVMHGPYAI